MFSLLDQALSYISVLEEGQILALMKRISLQREMLSIPA